MEKWMDGRREMRKVGVMIHCGIASGVGTEASKCCHGQALLESCGACDGVLLIFRVQLVRGGRKPVLDLQ